MITQPFFLTSNQRFAPKVMIFRFGVLNDNDVNRVYNVLSLRLMFHGGLGIDWGLI